MYDSGITVQSLIDRVISEADIALPISKDTYISWLNGIEQLLYSELVQEQKKTSVPVTSQTELAITRLTPSSGEAQPRFEDVFTIYHNDVQLIKSAFSSGPIFPNTWYQSGNNIGLNLADTAGTLQVVYYVRPALKATVSSGNVMVPVEFIEMVTAKLRGEAYKLANEDALAAKWLNDYNTQLEIFKVWLANRRAQFGM